MAIRVQSFSCIINDVDARRRAKRESLQVYGGDGFPIPGEGSWSCNLFTDAIYISHPNGTMFLELSPLMYVELSGSGGRGLFWISTPKGKRIDFVLRYFGVEKKMLPLINETEKSTS